MRFRHIIAAVFMMSAIAPSLSFAAKCPEAFIELTAADKQSFRSGETLTLGLDNGQSYQVTYLGKMFDDQRDRELLAFTLEENVVLIEAQMVGFKHEGQFLDIKPQHDAIASPLQQDSVLSCTAFSIGNCLKHLEVRDMLPYKIGGHEALMQAVYRLNERVGGHNYLIRTLTGKGPEALADQEQAMVDALEEILLSPTLSKSPEDLIEHLSEGKPAILNMKVTQGAPRKVAFYGEEEEIVHEVPTFQAAIVEGTGSGHAMLAVGVTDSKAPVKGIIVSDSGTGLLQVVPEEHLDPAFISAILVEPKKP
jgi:hypothetical protein